MMRPLLLTTLLWAACGNGDETALQQMNAPGPGENDKAGNPLPPGVEPETETCDTVGPRGRCVAGVLTRCDTGVAVSTTCADQGQVCGYSNDTIGYGCVAANQLGPNVVSGVAQYEDRPALPGKLEPIRLLPIRGATAWVVKSSDNSVLAKALTADDGSYVVHYDAPAGTTVRVTIGTTSPIAERPAKVTKNSGAVHGLGSNGFVTAAQTTKDLIATEASDLGHAFNVFDTLIYGLDLTRFYGETTLSSIEARYQRNYNSGSYYEFAPRRITLAGGPNDDGYDDTVILHEFGHYHQGEYGKSDNPGGQHPNPGGDDPRLAWGEGEATYIATAFRGVPYYIDTNYLDGGWYVELEQKVHKAKPNGTMSQFISEWMVAEFMWDVGDGAEEDGDADGVAGAHADAISVTRDYFFDPAYKNRGYSGVDLVEWIDGWFWQTGIESCSAMKALAVKYGFPYDFKGPVGCP